MEENLDCLVITITSTIIIQADFIENLQFGWLEAKSRLEKQGRTSQSHYDGKYQNKPPEYKEGELIRLKQPLTTAGLKIS